jgi:hypothetical protein
MGKKAIVASAAALLAGAGYLGWSYLRPAEKISPSVRFERSTPVGLEALDQFPRKPPLPPEKEGKGGLNHPPDPNAPPPAPAPARIEDWTAWHKCEAEWYQECEGEAIHESPDAAFEYCSHSVTEKSRSRGGQWQDRGPTGRGAKTWVAAYGGRVPWDRYSAWVEIDVKFRVIERTATPEERRRAGCSNADRPHIAACVTAGSSQLGPIKNCLGGDGSCIQFSDLKYSRCVQSPQQAQQLFTAECSNATVKRFDHVFLQNSPQCR